MTTQKTRLRLAALGLTLAAAFAGRNAAASPVPDYPFVHVVGSAFTAVLPDLAALDFEIVAVDADPDAAKTVLETRVGEIRALMQPLGLDTEDVVVREVRQTIRKGEQAPGGGPLYELRCDVKITVRNVTSWPALAAGVYGRPNLDGLSPSFDLSTIEQVKDELMANAIADARRRAGVIAAASGRRLGAVTAVTPEGIKNLSTAMGLQRDDGRMERRAGTPGAANVDREQLMALSAIKLMQPVDVIFRLENAPAAKPAAAKRP